MVQMHLKDTNIDRWLKVVKEGIEPISWIKFKVLFNKKFLPLIFEANGQMNGCFVATRERDCGEVYCMFSAISMKFTSSNDTTSLIEMHNYVHDLRPKL